jgi:hypothetical protein
MIHSEYSQQRSSEGNFTSYASQRLDERFVETGTSFSVSMEGGDSKKGFSAHKMLC